MDDVSIDPALKAEFMRENRKLLKAPPVRGIKVSSESDIIFNLPN